MARTTSSVGTHDGTSGYSAAHRGMTVDGTLAVGGKITATVGGIATTNLHASATIVSENTVTGVGLVSSSGVTVSSGDVNVHGNVTATMALMTGKFTHLAVTGTGTIGTRTIATGGSGVVSTSRVHTASVIVLTPKIATGGYYKTARANIKAVTPGTSFKITLFSEAMAGGTATITAATGAVNWAIINAS